MSNKAAPETFLTPLKHFLSGRLDLRNGTSPPPRRFTTRQILDAIDETDARWFAAMQQIRKKIHHDQSFAERLSERAHEARKQADLLPPGDLRDALLEKARQYEAQISLDAFLSNPGVR